MVLLTREYICSFGDAETAYTNIVNIAQKEAEIEEFITKQQAAQERNVEPESLLKRKQYDTERYQQHRDKYIQNALNYKRQLKDDIPRMRQKILKELQDGKRTWLATKTMSKYSITQDKATKTYA